MFDKMFFILGRDVGVAVPGIAEVVHGTLT